MNGKIDSLSQVRNYLSEEETREFDMYFAPTMSLFRTLTTIPKDKCYRFFYYITTKKFDVDSVQFGVIAQLVSRYINTLNRNRILTKSVGVCGATWHPGMVCFKCKTCEFDPTCAICETCFKNGDHKGHDYSMVTSSSGICDCGDPDSWKRSGFCKNHKGPEADPLGHLDQTLIGSLRSVSDSLIDSLVFFLTDDSQKKKIVKKKKKKKVKIGETEGEMEGEEEFKLVEKKYDRYILFMLSIIQSFPCFKRLFGLSLSSTKAGGRENESNLSCLISLQRNFVFENRKALADFYTTLISDPKFKIDFTNSFCDEYKQLCVNFTDRKFESKDLPLAAITVQLFTIPNIITNILIPRNFIDTALDTIIEIVDLHSSRVHFDRKVVVLKDFKPYVFYHCIIDLQYLFNFGETSRLLLTTPRLLDKFLEILNFYQYALILTRVDQDDIRQRWREVSSSEFWRIPKLMRIILQNGLSQLREGQEDPEGMGLGGLKEVLVRIVSQVVRCIYYRFHKEFLKGVFPAMSMKEKLEKLNSVIDGPISFHIPLHHFLGYLLHMIHVKFPELSIYEDVLFPTFTPENLKDLLFVEEEEVSRKIVEDVFWSVFMYPMKNIFCNIHVLRGFWRRNCLGIANISVSYFATPPNVDYTNLNDHFLFQMLTPIFFLMSANNNNNNTEEVITDRLLKLCSFDSSKYFKKKEKKTITETRVNPETNEEEEVERTVDAVIKDQPDRFFSCDTTSGKKEDRETDLEIDFFKLLIRLITDNSLLIMREDNDENETSWNPYQSVTKGYLLHELFNKSCGHKKLRASVPRIIRKGFIEQRGGGGDDKEYENQQIDMLISDISDFEVDDFSEGTSSKYVLKDEELWKLYNPYHFLVSFIPSVQEKVNQNYPFEKEELMKENLEHHIQKKKDSFYYNNYQSSTTTTTTTTTTTRKIVKEAFERLVLDNETIVKLMFVVFYRCLRLKEDDQESQISDLMLTTLLHYFYISLLILENRSSEQQQQQEKEEEEKEEKVLGYNFVYHEIEFYTKKRDYLSLINCPVKISMKKPDDEDDNVRSISLLEVLYTLKERQVFKKEILLSLKKTMRASQKKRRRDVILTFRKLKTKFMMMEQNNFENNMMDNNNNNNDNDEDEEELKRKKREMIKKKKQQLLEQFNKMAKKFEESLSPTKTPQTALSTTSTSTGGGDDIFSSTDPFEKEILKQQQECIFCHSSESPENEKLLHRLCHFSRSSSLNTISYQNFVHFVELLKNKDDNTKKKMIRQFTLLNYKQQDKKLWNIFQRYIDKNNSEDDELIDFIFFGFFQSTLSSPTFFNETHTQINGCGHLCHSGCFHSYWMSLLRSIIQRRRIRGGEYLNITDSEILCPVCSRIQNSLVGTKDTDTDTDTDTASSEFEHNKMSMIDRLLETLVGVKKKEKAAKIDYRVFHPKTETRDGPSSPNNNMISQLQSGYGEKKIRKFEESEHQFLKDFTHLKHLHHLMNTLISNLEIQHQLDNLMIFNTEERKERINIFSSKRRLRKKNVRDLYFIFASSREILKSSVFPILTSEFGEEINEKYCRFISSIYWNKINPSRKEGEEEIKVVKNDEYMEALGDYPFLMLDMFSCLAKLVCFDPTIKKGEKFHEEFSRVVRIMLKGQISQFFLFMCLKNSSTIEKVPKKMKIMMENNISTKEEEDVEMLKFNFLDSGGEIEELLETVVFNFLKKCLLFYDLFTLDDGTEKENEKEGFKLTQLYDEIIFDRQKEEQNEEENEGEVEEKDEERRIKRMMGSKICQFFNFSLEELEEEKDEDEQVKYWVGEYCKFREIIITRTKEEEELTEEEEDLRMKLDVMVTPYHILNTFLTTSLRFNARMTRLYEDLYLEHKDRKICAKCERKMERPFLDLMNGELTYRGKMVISGSMIASCRRCTDELCHFFKLTGMKIGGSGEEEMMSPLQVLMNSYMENEEDFFTRVRIVDDDDGDEKHVNNLFLMNTYIYCGNGIYLDIKRSNLYLLISNNTRLLFLSSPYRDRYHQQDIELRRGKPLFLNQEYVSSFVPLFLLNCFEQNTKMISKSKSVDIKTLVLKESFKIEEMFNNVPVNPQHQVIVEEEEQLENVEQ